MKSDQLYAERRGEEIEITPEFAKLFIESSSFSSNIYNRNSYMKLRKIQSAFEAAMEEYSIIEERGESVHKFYPASETKQGER